jgi:hypothetical protein
MLKDLLERYASITGAFSFAYLLQPRVSRRAGRQALKLSPQEFLH